MIGRLLGNRYQITDRIGLGGMAEVYRAQDNVLGRNVAVKVMLPQFAEDANFTERFRQEAAAAANLSSPYIVNVYDWGNDQGTYYIVMEYVRGSDLKTAINQRGAINQRKVAEIGSQVCSALSVAHNMDIVHRDVKPQNIMVQPDGNVKVMDFGIARAKNSVMEKTGSVLGTAHYISPEQAQGKDLTPASDIYSLGVVLYEASTGTLPFDGPDAVSVAMKQVNETPIPPREVNPNIDASLEAIILKAMAKNPRERFATAQEMRRALNDFLAGRPVNLGGFDAARTQVMSGPVVAPISGGSDSTSVMPVVDSTDKGQTVRSYTTDSHTDKAPMSKGKIAGIIIAVVAVIAVIAVACAALGLFGGSSSASVTVPNVTGKTEAEATAMLEDVGLTVGTIEQKASDTVDEGKVISQTPAGNSQAEKGTKVTLVVSSGKEQVEVPDLSKMTASEARSALSKAGLNYEAGAAEYSDDVDENHVARQSPAAGEKVDKGTKVTYYLSAGPKGTEVPDVSGMSEGSAIATLNNAGFYVTTEYQSSTRVAQGLVISQTPTAGSKEKDGATVNIVVSTGEETYSVSTSYTSSEGYVSPDSTEVEAGGSVTFTVTPNSGYTVSSVTDSMGTSYTVAPSGGSFTISNVTRNIAVKIVFAQTSEHH